MDPLNVAALLSPEVIQELARDALNLQQGPTPSARATMRSVPRSPLGSPRSEESRRPRSPGSPPPLVPSARLAGLSRTRSSPGRAPPAVASKGRASQEGRRVPAFGSPSDSSSPTGSPGGASSPGTALTEPPAADPADALTAVPMAEPKAEPKEDPKEEPALKAGKEAAVPDTPATATPRSKSSTPTVQRRRKDDGSKTPSSAVEELSTGTRKTLSEKDAAGFAKRLTEWAKDRDKRRHDLHEQARSQEMPQQLQISARSRKLAAHVKPVHERLDDIMQGRREAWHHARMRQEELEMKDATMRPMISARARNMEPRFGDQGWSQRREQRISAGQQARQEQQLVQCTFKPQINKASQTMDRRAQAISFRSGCRPASSSAKARRPSASAAESTGQADGAKGAPVSFEDFVKQRSEPETAPTPAGSRPQSLGALKAAPAPEAGIDFQTFLGNTGWGCSESATPRQARNGARPAEVSGSSPPPSPSAPLLGPILDDEEFIRRASAPVLAPTSDTTADRDVRTPRDPSRTATPRTRWAKKGGEEMSLSTSVSKPQWRPSGPSPVKAAAAPALGSKRSSVTSTAPAPEAHIVPYCSEFEDVFKFTAQLCR